VVGPINSLLWIISIVSLLCLVSLVQECPLVLVGSVDYHIATLRSASPEVKNLWTVGVILTHRANSSVPPIDKRAKPVVDLAQITSLIASPLLFNVNMKDMVSFVVSQLVSRLVLEITVIQILLMAQL